MRLYYILLIILVVLTGCSKPKEQLVNEIVEEDQELSKEEKLSEEEQKEIMKEFYKILSEAKNKENLIGYIEDNFEKLDSEFVDELVLSLEEYLDIVDISISEKIEILTKYYDYSTDELKSYLDILKTEGQNMFTDGEGLKVELNEILDRALISERHLKMYHGGKTVDRIKNYYIAYITGSIVGTGNQYIYGEEGSSKIRQDVIDIYNSVIEKNKESHTSEILELYIDNLNKDNNDLNGENVLKFYDELDFLLQSLF